MGDPFLMHPPRPLGVRVLPDQKSAEKGRGRSQTGLSHIWSFVTMLDNSVSIPLFSDESASVLSETKVGHNPGDGYEHRKWYSQS